MTGSETTMDIGFTATYIHDYNFAAVTELPVEAAVAWVKATCPNASIGSRSNGFAKDVTINVHPDTDATGNGWLNKLFVVVGESNSGNLLALYNADGHFWLYSKRTGN
jgi:hypothetical protein